MSEYTPTPEHIEAGADAAWDLIDKTGERPVTGIAAAVLGAVGPLIWRDGYVHGETDGYERGWEKGHERGQRDALTQAADDIGDRYWWREIAARWLRARAEQVNGDE